MIVDSFQIARPVKRYADDDYSHSKILCVVQQHSSIEEHNKKAIVAFEVKKISTGSIFQMIDITTNQLLTVMMKSAYYEVSSVKSDNIDVTQNFGNKLSSNHKVTFCCGCGMPFVVESNVCLYEYEKLQYVEHAECAYTRFIANSKYHLDAQGFYRTTIDKAYKII